MAYFERRGIDTRRVEQMIDIESPEDARDFIKEHIESSIFPVISVPEEYVAAAKNGIQPHTTWIGEQIIAGTIGREPYMPSSETRHLFSVRIPAD